MCNDTERNQARVNVKVSVRSGSMNGSRKASSASASMSIVALTNPLAAQALQRAFGVARQRQREQLPHLEREAVGQPVDRAEVDDPEPAVGQHPEVAGMWVGMQQTGPLGPDEQELHVARGGGVAGLGGTGRDDGRQGGPRPAIR